MDKLDRLGWAESICIRAFGVRIGVRLSERSALQAVIRCVPPGATALPVGTVDRLYSLVVGGVGRRGLRRLNVLYANTGLAARHREIDEVLHALESDLHLFVAEVAPRRIFVHAGVVGWKGVAIIVPGPSFSGKSSLVAELVRRGATYYSDEFAVLDSRGRVYPYARPLSLRTEGALNGTRYECEELGGSRGVKPLPVGAVVMTRFRSGARWLPRHTSPGAGAMAVLANTVSVRSRPSQALVAVRRAVEQAVVVKGVRGEASEVADWILGQQWRSC